MQFDVIIGNPPYQLSDGGAQASARPIYHLFVQQAKKLNPRYLIMITPARWYAGGKGLDEYRNEMLNDSRIRVIHDFLNSFDCFPSLGQNQIKGGISYFLWNRDSRGLCKIYTYSDGKIISEAERPLLEKNAETFIRYNEAIPILRKVQAKNEKSFSEIVSSRKPFGLPTNFTDFKTKPFENSIKIYANQKIGYIEQKQVLANNEWINLFKIYVPKATGVGNVKTDWLKPILAEPNTCCTETYIVLGTYKNKNEAENVISYTQTKFFHLLLSLKKITQDTTNKVYQFVPLQDFSEPWTDEKLYKKYGLTQEEIDFIESMIRPME